MPSEQRPLGSYEAGPGEVGRVLLLCSGGRDTSVMLKWIQDEYGAEVATLTLNLGQPGEDYEVIEGKARDLGAVECFIVDAREEFAEEYVLPAIKANALYGGGYPLFTALGRAPIAKIAVDKARAARCAAPGPGAQTPPWPGRRRPAATASPTAAPARATTRFASTRPSSRTRPT